MMDSYVLMHFWRNLLRATEKPQASGISAPDMYEYHKKQQATSTVFWDSTVLWVVLNTAYCGQMITGTQHRTRSNRAEGPNIKQEVGLVQEDPWWVPQSAFSIQFSSHSFFSACSANQQQS